MRGSLKMVVIGACAAGLWACAGERDGNGGVTAKDAGRGAGGAISIFGQGCRRNADCPEGLLCMQSEFTPTAFCTRFCETPADYCDGPGLGGVTALCVRMPGSWNGPTRKVCDPDCRMTGRPFCVPTCQNTAQCKARWSSWEKCAKPAYKNVPLYNALPTKVCMAPSSHGQPVIDPRTCDWESRITESAVLEAKQLCKAHCEFLTTCQLFDPKVEAASCCTWRCFQRMTPQGVIDQKRKAHIKCFLEAYQAAATTPKVCTLYKEQCESLEYPRG